MIGFTKKSVGTLTLGEKLKKLRSERRSTLGEVSRYTRIQTKYLEYLENGDYGKLPADVYTKGFLRGYAEFLGVDERAFLKQYDKERGIKKNLEKSKSPQSDERKEINISPFVVTPKMIIAGSVILLVLAGIFYLYREVGSFASAPRLVILSPDKNYTLDGTSVSVEGITDRDDSLFINDQPTLVGDDGKFRENLTVQPGMNIVTIKAVNRFKKEAAETLTIQSTYKPADQTPSVDTAAGGQAPAEAVKGVNVEIRVDPGPVWLSVETDGNLVFSGTMLTGASQNFKASDKISINSGKGNATFVKFNGKDIGTLSDSTNAVRGVTFTADTKY